LEALVTADPKCPLIPKLVKGLLESRRNGHWGCTQANLWAILALEKYISMMESDKTNYESRAWIGTQFCGEIAVKNYTMDSYELNIPMKFAFGDSTKTQKDAEGPVGVESRELMITKDGPGRLYYHIGVHFAPTTFSVNAFSNGFTINRTYLPGPSEEKGVVSGNNIDGWIFKKGKVIKIQITVHTPKSRYNVALVDKLPAGLEIDNDLLKNQPNANSWIHKNYREEGAECFAISFTPGDGVKTFEYLARATTVGKFNIPPARIEEMYTPDISAQTKSSVAHVQ